MRAQEHPEYPYEHNSLQRALAALAARMDELAHADLITAYDNAAEALLVQYRAEYRGLKQVADSPYFARIDFVPFDREDAEAHYIGKKGFEHEGRAVIDWRAPLAVLFYKAKPGEVDYTGPAGAIRGLMQLKRNLDIKTRELVTIADDFDIRPDRPGVAEPGAFLREKLAARRDPYLQEIIATIQAHQYDLIQADARQALVVQGVAGSGKTSIALHRLAYLLHPGNAEGVEARRCIIFGPNRLFLSYIGVVLPDLDIGQVAQTTFVDWACEQLKIDPRQVADATLDAMLSPDTPADRRAALFQRSRLLNSHRMGQLLERHVERRRRPAIPRGGLSYYSAGRLKVTVHLPFERIDELHRQYAGLPLTQHRARFVEAMRSLLTRGYDEAVLAKLEEQSGEDGRFAAQAGQLRDEAGQLQRLAIMTRGLNDARLNSQSTADSLDRGAKGLLELAEHYQRQGDVALSRARRRREEVYADGAWRQAVEELAVELGRHLDRFWPSFDAVTEYHALLSNQTLLAELSDGLLAPDEVALLHRSLATGGTDVSDLPALHYLQTLAEGVTPAYDHIVIDEAQDASRLQLETVRRFSRNGSLTILGDLPQSIYAHRGIAAWDEAREAFAGLPFAFHEITIGYRTTYEITAFANAVLKSLAATGSRVGLAQPFERHGEPPQLHRLEREPQLPEMIANVVQSIRAQGYDNIAIITKSADAAVGLAVNLYDHSDGFEVIESAEVAYHGGLVILPVHLAKGMEFEAALVVGADEATYSASEFDGRLLYVAITRALHILHVFWSGRISQHLAAVSTA